MLLLQSYATAGSDRDAIEADEAKQLKDARTQARAPFQSGSLITREVRSATLHDSGQPNVISCLRHVDSHFNGDVSFLISQFALHMMPHAPGDPVWFNDMSSYTLQPVSGSVRVMAESVTMLFNAVMFVHGPGGDPPLHGFNFSLDDGTPDMHTEVYWRDAWVPIELRGPLVLRDPQTVVFHPNVIKVRGQDAGAPMGAVHIELADLLPVSTPAVQLADSEVIMQAPKLFPPPALELKFSAIRVTHGGLLIRINNGNPQMSPLTHAADAQCPYILFRDGDICFTCSMPMSVRIDIVVADPTKPFMFNLYRCRDQLVAGSLCFSPNDGIRVLIPLFDTLAATKAAKMAAIVKAGRPALQPARGIAP